MSNTNKQILRLILAIVIFIVVVIALVYVTIFTSLRVFGVIGLCFFIPLSLYATRSVWMRKK